MVEPVNPAPLEDVMAAMDVVDTLRHQQAFAARELDDEGRRERLKERLKQLYQAQGIEVPDHVLEEGIAALEEERFQYQQVPTSWRRRLAHIWVGRTRWGKPLGFLTVLGGLFSGVYFATDVLPQRQLLAELPVELNTVVEQIADVSSDEEVTLQARRQLNQAKAALQEERVEDAQSVLADMQSVLSQLESTYSIRVIARAGEQSGAWRVPAINPSARNYYLIVEAVDEDNKAVVLDILDEETNRSKRVSTWGLRVSEETFFKVAADKQDDGIIQNNIVGSKKLGQMEPSFSIATTGGTITKW